MILKFTALSVCYWNFVRFMTLGRKEEEKQLVVHLLFLNFLYELYWILSVDMEQEQEVSFMFFVEFFKEIVNRTAFCLLLSIREAYIFLSSKEKKLLHYKLLFVCLKSRLWSSFLVFWILYMSGVLDTHSFTYLQISFNFISLVFQLAIRWYYLLLPLFWNLYCSYYAQLIFAIFACMMVGYAVSYLFCFFGLNKVQKLIFG